MLEYLRNLLGICIFLCYLGTITLMSAGSLFKVLFRGKFTKIKTAVLFFINFINMPRRGVLHMFKVSRIDDSYFYKVSLALLRYSLVFGSALVMLFAFDNRVMAAQCVQFYSTSCKCDPWEPYPGSWYCSTFGGHDCKNPDGSCNWNTFPKIDCNCTNKTCSVSSVTCGPVVVDTTRPACGGITPTPGPPSNASSVSINATATDDVGVTKTGLYVESPKGSNNWVTLVPNGTSNNGNVTSTWTTPSGTGTYKITANWWDAAGNFQQCVQDYVLDRIAPLCTPPTYPLSNANSVTVNFSATDIGQGIQSTGLYYRLASGGSWNTVVANGTVSTGNESKVVSGLGSAYYTFAANWWDRVNNFKQCTSTYNNTRPTSSISGPSQVCLVSGVLKNPSTGAAPLYKANPYDSGGDLKSVLIASSPNPSPPTGSWTLIGSSSVSGTSGSYSASATSSAMGSTGSYYVVTNAYDTLDHKCTGNPWWNFSSGDFTDCGSVDAMTVSVITTPPAVSNLREVSPHPLIVTFRWDYAGLPIESYNISGPGTPGNRVCYPGNFCQASYWAGNCTQNYTYTVSANNACGTGTSKLITVSPNCVPTCSLSFSSGGNPFAPNSTVSIKSVNDAGDPGDYIASYQWNDNGPDKGVYVTGTKTQNSVSYKTIDSYGRTTNLSQWVYDSKSTTYIGTCSINVKTADPTINVRISSGMYISKRSSAATTQSYATYDHTLFNDNAGTLALMANPSFSISGSTVENICNKSGVTCSFAYSYPLTSVPIGKNTYGASTGSVFITVPRSFLSGTYGYGIKLTSTDWKGSALTSEDKSFVTVSNLAPTCSKPILGEYAKYGSVGYPLGHTIDVIGSGADVDGTISSYKWNVPSVGAIPNVNVNPVTYTTASNYNTSTTLSYSVTDSSGTTVNCPASDIVWTLVQPGVSTSWYNYLIDINKTTSDAKNFTWTQSGTSSGFDVSTSFSIDKSNDLVGGKTNICMVTGVTCLFAGDVSSINETVAGASGSTSKPYSLTITVPTSISVGSYGVRISGSNTYRGSSYPFDNTKTVFITASTSDISITCADGTTGNCYTFSQNRGWGSGALTYKIKSTGFAGTFNVVKDSSSICGVTGVTCPFSSDGTNYSSDLSSVSIAEDATATIYMKVQTSASTPPDSYTAKFKSTGTRANVKTLTAEKISPPTLVTLNNQAPTCGTRIYSFMPNTPVSLASTVKVVVGGGSDPDSDAITYGDWSVTSANSITAVSGETNSANVVMNNVYASCTEVRYKVYDNYSGVSSTCVVPSSLCTVADTTPPTATISGAGSVCKGGSYAVGITAADNNSLASASIYRSDSTTPIATKTDNLTNPTTLSGDTTFNTAGTYYVYPVVKDINNNVCDSSVSGKSCGTDTYKQVIVNENSSAPTMSFLTYSNDPTRVKITWAKPDSFSASNYSLSGPGTIDAITCSGNDCWSEVSGLLCTSDYSYTLSETDGNSCGVTSSINSVSPNCAPLCGAPTIKPSDIPASGLYPLNTSVTINSNKSSNKFDDEDVDSVTHIWVPTLNGSGFGGITGTTPSGSTATYLTPNRNNVTAEVKHSVEDTGGPNDANNAKTLCGAVRFPMVADGLNNQVFSPSDISIARTSANPTGSSDFKYDLSNYQSGTFAIDTTNTANASFIGNNICTLTSLLICSGNATAPVGVNKSLPFSLTFKDGARSNFDTTKAYKVKGTVSYTTTDVTGADAPKSGSAYLNVVVANNAPTCSVYSRTSNESGVPWVDVTNKYYTYQKGATVYLRTVGTDLDGDTFGSYAWSQGVSGLQSLTTQDTSYVIPSNAGDGMNDQVKATVYETSPNNLSGFCITVIKTPDPGTHTLSGGTVNGSSTSVTLAYSYSGYVNENNGVGVDGTSTISTSTDAIAGYTNICGVPGVACKFEGLNVGDGLTVASGSSGTKNIIISFGTTGSTRLDNRQLYAARVLFSAPTTGGGTITASTTGGVITIVDAIPACGTISISPTSVYSGSGNTVQITANAVDDWKMSSVKLEYNNNITGTNAGIWTEIGTISTFTNSLNPTAVFTWNPTALGLGKYLLQATWKDNHSPVQQGAVCSAKNPSVANDPTSPTDTNNATASVIGNRFSGRVLIQQDADLYKVVRRDAVASEFSITSSAGATTWKGLDGADCKATYPDGVNDTNTCADYFVSNTEHVSGAQLTATVNVAGTKYVCTYDVWGLNAFGVKVKKIANGNGCTTSAFSVEPGHFLYTPDSKWTSEVDFYLTYNTDRVSGQVLDYAGAGLGGYTITNGYIPAGVTSLSVPVIGSYNYPISSDSKDYFPNGNRSFTLSGSDIGSDASPKKCFYAFNNIGATRSFTSTNSTNVQSIARGGFDLANWTIAEGCTTANLPITHGNLSPQRQNYLYFFIVPKITVDPASSLTVVYDCASKSSPSVPTFVPTADLYTPTSATLPKIGGVSYVPSNGTFSIVNPGTSILTELKWNQLYQADLTVGYDYIVCDNRTPAFTVSATDASSINVSSALPNYPSTIPSHNQVKFNFYATLKNSNDWWQVYNGGVHSNGIMDLDRLPSVLASNPVPVKAPLVGIPTDNPSNERAPEIFYMQYLSSYYSPALVSSSSTTNINFHDDGKAGMSGTEWFANQMTNGISAPYTNSFFDDIQKIGSGWNQITSSVDSLGSKTSPMYFMPSGSETVNPVVSYNDNKIVAVIFPSANNVLTIRNDILSGSQDKILILIVKGNVMIDSNVQNIYAAIYATGNITVKTKGDETDLTLHVYGSLYSDSITFKRDLPNTSLNIGVPAEKIIFNPRIIVSGAYPQEMKQANVFWVVRD